MAKGFVYVFSNPAMPGLAKIGFTTKVPPERAAELSSTGVPEPFVVEYYCLVDEAATLEAKVHATLQGVRQTNDREFFRVSVHEAIATISTLAVHSEHAWRRAVDEKSRPSQVACQKCGASYVSALYCPKCRTKLKW